MSQISPQMIGQLIAQVGGAGNIVQAGNCMTRLRLTLHRQELADIEAIRQLSGIMGVIVSDEQLQVVFGPGHARSAAEMVNKMLEEPSSAGSDTPSLLEIASAQKEQLKGKQTNRIQKFLATFATIFTPLIPGFIAVGLL
ncbi:PTS transporter subunit EIIB, partial [Serratia marcescens]|nr:PTS transporter subunit EIIB [Serratia marcescens]